MARLLFVIAFTFCTPLLLVAQGRPLLLSDIDAIVEVDDASTSADGKWIAYALKRTDVERDENDTDIWMQPIEGGPAVRLTNSKKGESHPRFSPDGKWIAFLSAREGKTAQIWIASRQGGDPERVTSFGGDVSAFEWSPDSRRIVAVVRDADPEASDDEKKKGDDGDAEAKQKPIVIRRRQFLRDGEGWLREQRDHLWLFDVMTREKAQLTEGACDDVDPTWSPDGSLIAFSSNRTDDPDSNQNTDIFVVAPQVGSKARSISTSPSAEYAPRFAPDGSGIAWIRDGDPADLWYGTSRIVARSSLEADGNEIDLTGSLDRNVFGFTFQDGGKTIVAILEDGGRNPLIRVPLAGGAIERVDLGEREVSWIGAAGEKGVVILDATPSRLSELTLLEGDKERRLTHANDALLARLRFSPAERRQAKNEDGTMVDYFLQRPSVPVRRAKKPVILWLHGGPTAQYTAAFDPTWQVLAAAGYTVIAPNPRGSTGYGRDFSRAIWADWGNKDLSDILAALDDALKDDVLDPEAVGVGGWSYGGILTNYAIIKSKRFKAAVSGASEVNYTACYGTDHYQYEWETELGLPWKNVAKWIEISPFFHVESVETPTLVMCGEDDVNVPLINSQQLYLALKRRGIPTELIVYPGMPHGISKPSYRSDRFARIVAWYDKYLKESTPPSAMEARIPEATSLLGEPLFAPKVPEARLTALEANLDKATREFIRNPDGADAILWLGRRLAYVGRFREALAVFSRGIAKHPKDWRFLRHRGHRYITLRDFKKAAADLEQAATMIADMQPIVEPDGDPNAAGIPVATSHFSVYYHLGLAHYLNGDFEAGATAYAKGMTYCVDAPDRLVAMSDWYWRTLMRLGRKDEAAKLLEPIAPGMTLIENFTYYRLLLLYKGVVAPGEVLGDVGSGTVDGGTLAYGLANWHLVRGETEAAKKLFERIVSEPNWPAFGHIAAEVELAREKK